jgi:hypothetical protein
VETAFSFIIEIPLLSAMKLFYNNTAKTGLTSSCFNPSMKFVKAAKA